MVTSLVTTLTSKLNHEKFVLSKSPVMSGPNLFTLNMPHCTVPRNTQRSHCFASAKNMSFNYTPKQFRGDDLKDGGFPSPRHKSPIKRVFRLADSRVYSSARNGDNQSKGEEPPESLFMKELKKRGLTPSLLQDYEGDEEEIKTGKETGKGSLAFDQSLLNQRERSLALNSEGLEGLIPRAKILLTIGGTFCLGFWPFILLTVAAFSVLYLYFGSDFVHDGSRTTVSPPPYIDPYTLLEDERLSGIDLRVN